MNLDKRDKPDGNRPDCSVETPMPPPRILFLRGDGHVSLSPWEVRALKNLVFMGIRREDLRLEEHAGGSLTIRFDEFDSVTLWGDWRGARIWVEIWGDGDGSVDRLLDLAARQGIPASTGIRAVG